MDNSHFPIALVSIIFLFFGSGRVTASFDHRRSALKALKVSRRPPGMAALLRAVLAFAAGLSLAGLLQVEAAWSTVVVGGSIALAAWGRIRARGERRSAAPEILQLLRHLAGEIESGADLFASLGMARGFLPEGLVRRAVDRTIEGYAQRLPLADCLRPLGRVDPILAGLAADVRRIGWEASPELADAVRLVRADAFRRWDRKRWNRVLADRITGLLPHLRGFAAVYCIY
jgi:hypothetical protein